MSDRCITAADLAAHGLTPADVRLRCPWAVERVGLAGEPCWDRADLTPLLGDDEEGEA